MARRGRRVNRGRAVDGIIVVDKVYGASSNEVLQRVKRLFNAAKAGHTGSLDPLATGVLPICLGEATKFSQYLLDSDKSYRTTMKMGVQTTTGDREGEVVAERPVAVTRSDVEAILDQFRGEIEQVPSMFSALKHNGRPLYEYAREGIEIDRPSRKITIHRLELLDFEGDECVFEVDCTKGTYIRTLVEDIGAALGCLGHVAELKRLKAGPYTEHQAYSLDELAKLRDEGREAALDVEQRVEFAELAGLADEIGRDKLEKSQAERFKDLGRIRNKAGDRVIDELLLPLDSAVSDWPQVKLGANSSFFVAQGNPVQVPQAPTSGNVRIYGIAEGEEDLSFFGVGEITDDGLVAPKRLIKS
ncbi:tRNA pseudouridine(55) synthase TruB [Endozoicomonas ascidiicola]|uniref:tRNA pseudouridine(55) synthase TruB n=1 Tax=Endozoicomonas ascidiicola TaxID=1698521 RepID=UPI000837681A|nr:tRNA pseudouridine(55) synthase TruB [Endozoicomonas ascidiicola]